MVESEHNPETGERAIVLMPNGSLSRRQSIALLAFCALLMGTVAGVFASLGAWPVVPFSGLEWLLFAWCLGYGLRNSAQREVITIGKNSIRVERGRKSPERVCTFQRAWVTVCCSRSPISGRPSRLILRLHGKEVEIGRFLVESERQELARELRAILSAR